MTSFASAKVRTQILASLSERGLAEIGEHDGLFTTGLLDSLAATEILMALEGEYGIDLADEDFDILEIDTLHGIETLVSARKAAARAEHVTA